MWQLFALGSVFSFSFEEVVDRFALVAQPTIDNFIATFVRICWYVLFILLLGLSGVLGKLSLLINPAILFMVVISVPSTLFFTYLMRRVEVTSIGVLSYLAPFFYLLIDTKILATPFSMIQLLGITLLVLGGLGFAIDTQTWHLKREFSPIVLCMFVFNVVYTGIEAYTFKYLNVAYGLNGVSYMFDVWTGVLVILLVFVLFQGKQKLLMTGSVRKYVRRTCVSKLFDATGSVLWAQALVFAAVSQVSAMESLMPIFLFVVAWVAQSVFGMRLKEHTERKNLLWKSGALSLLLLGGLLVG